MYALVGTDPLLRVRRADGGANVANWGVAERLLAIRVRKAPCYVPSPEHGRVDAG